MPFDIGCHSPAELRLLPPVLRALCQEWPALRPQLHTIPFELLFGMVENRQLSAALSLYSGTKKQSSLTENCFPVPWPASARRGIPGGSGYPDHGYAEKL